MPPDNLTNVTGMSPQPPHLVTVRFGNYDITIRIGPDNEFLGIHEIAFAKSFLSLEQRRSAVGCHDVTDLYEDK